MRGVVVLLQEGKQARRKGESLMPTKPLRNNSSRVALGVGISVLLAVGIAGLVHVLVPSPGSSPHGTTTEPSYLIDPASLALTKTDVGASFPLVIDGRHAPSQQHGLVPPPYQQQFTGGWARNFMVQSALVPPGRTEIETYEQARGVPLSDPPLIFGPFVADHQGLFEVYDIELTYHVASAAHPDYLCCDGGSTVNYTNNYDNWQTYPIQLGDEANAWGGIRRMPTDPPQDYEEQTFRIRWRHGPVVSTLFIRGAHDLTLDPAMHLAQIVDARIASALQQTQQAAKGASHGPDPQDVAPSTSICLALCSADRRAGRWLHWT